MLFEDPYTFHSIVDFIVGTGGVTTGTTVFSFPKNALRSDHIQVYHKLIAAPTVWNLISSSNYTITGSSGAWTVTLGGGFPARTNDDQIRIRRVTPTTAATRVVDFQAGSLAEADLDTSALQETFLAQENQDKIRAITFLLEDVPASILGPGYTWSSV